MRVTDPEPALGAAGPAEREDPRDDALRRALVALKDLRARQREAEERQHGPIAVVGMACRFPGGARDPAAFWRLLREGGDAVVEVPGDRWDLAAFYDPDPAAPGKMYSRWGGFLSDPVDAFDAPLFGISGREAEQMDPQQRLLLELAWEAFEDAGYAPGGLAGSATGVFVGLAANDYLQQLLGRGHPDGIGPHSAVGNLASVAAGRISYVFGLEGPSLPVDTACSSSLVATHLAMESLRRGECTTALAGGVNLLLGPASTIAMCKLRALSPSGRCRTFDAAADGYVRAEGGGLLVLKRLADARLAGDRVLALLRGSAVNHDGRSSGLTVPNGRAQEAVIRRALAAAALAPAAIDYVEAHGTGTQLGDPIEIHALARIFGPGRPPERPLIVGSVKTNLGHLEAAAGCASLVKVVLAMQESEIPAHLHLRQLNPHIEVGDFPLCIPAAPLPWPAAERPRLAGVSSFGIGGTNAHLIVEAAPPAAATPPAGEPERPVLLTFSGATETARRAVAGRLARHLAAAPEELRLVDAAFTANAGRSALAWRGAVVAANVAEAAARLRDAGEAAAPASALLPGRRAEAGGPRTAFLFAGEGAEYPGMGGELYRDHPVCRALLDRCAEILRPLGVPLLEALLPAGGEEAARLLARTDCAQPALFAVGVALAELWRGWGIEPAAVLGEGVGEVAAACVAGIFELEPGLRLAAERGRLRQEQRAGGAAAAEPLLDALEAAADRIDCSPPRLPFVAGASGTMLSASSTLDGRYWRQQAGRPARWADGIAALAAAGCGAYLECGPPVPWARGGAAGPGAGAPWLASLGRGPGKGARLLESLGELYVRGAEVNWAALHAAAPRHRVRLPTYPFERRRFPLAPASAPAAGAAPPRSPVAPAAASMPAATPRPGSGSGSGEGTLAEELRGLEPACRRERLAAFLAWTFAAALGIEDVPAAGNLFELGLDSLLAMEAVERLKPELGFPIYPREIYERPTIDQLAPYLAGELERAMAPAPAVAAAASPAVSLPPRVSGPLHAGAVLQAAAAAAPPVPAAAPLPAVTPLPAAAPVPGVVLLLSAPRSGSTLLRVLLAGHPRLFSPPELHLLAFDTLDDRRQALAASHLDEGLDRAVRELRELGGDAEALAALERPGLPIPEVYRALRRAAGNRLLIDKSPTYAARREILERAEAWLDGARYIHLVRHPLSVIESFVRLRMDRLAGAADDDPYRLAERLWVDANRNVASFFAALPSQRRMRVRFEELVREPARVMAEVCGFLGVELDARMLELDSGRRMTDGLTARSLAVGDPGFLARQGIDASLAERWREVVLPAPLGAEAERLASELGYELPQPPPPRAAPAAATPAPREALAVAAGETFVDLGGHSQCVCAWGPAAGPAALCLHGILDQAAAWEELASRLAGEQGWRVVAPDLRGHGRSPHVEPGGAYHLLDFVAHADALAGLLGPAPLILVGHSMGALVAALLAAGRPRRCAWLVLIEPPVLRPAARPWAESLAVLLEDAAAAAAHPVWPDLATAVVRLRAAVPALSEERALALARRGTEPVAGGGVRWRWDPRLQRRTRLAFGLGAGTDGGGYSELLRQVPAPITLVFGRDGDLVREPLWEELARELPGVRRCVVDGGHHLHLEAPAALAALLAAGP